MDITTGEVSRAHREDFYAALRKNDLARLSQIYSDDYILVRSDGTAFSKAQILDDLKTHAMTFPSIELANERIRIYGSVGILTGDSRITTVRDGKESKTRFRLVAVYCKQSDASSLFIFKVVRFRNRTRVEAKTRRSLNERITESGRKGARRS